MNNEINTTGFSTGPKQPMTLAQIELNKRQEEIKTQHERARREKFEIYNEQLMKKYDILDSTKQDKTITGKNKKTKSNKSMPKSKFNILRLKATNIAIAAVVAGSTIGIPAAIAIPPILEEFEYNNEINNNKDVQGLVDVIRGTSVGTKDPDVYWRENYSSITDYIDQSDNKEFLETWFLAAYGASNNPKNNGIISKTLGYDRASEILNRNGIQIEETNKDNIYEGSIKLKEIFKDNVINSSKEENIANNAINEMLNNSSKQTTNTNGGIKL